MSVYRTTGPLVMIVQSMKMHRAQKDTTKALNYHVGALAYLGLCSWLGPDDRSLVWPTGVQLLDFIGSSISELVCC